jgi:hypothetical protein
LPQGGIASRNIETHDIPNFNIRQQSSIHPVADGSWANVVALCQVFFYRQITDPFWVVLFFP